jgi:uncharacterized protein (DUF1919 family)
MTTPKLEAFERFFAIYRNNLHIGNEVGKNEKEAIINYIKSCPYSNDIITDQNFFSKYSAVLAIKKIHYN